MSSIQKYAFKKGLPQEFEVVDLGAIFTEIKDELTHPHRLDFYQVLWFKAGRKTHMVDFEMMTIEPNTLLFVSKNSVQMFSDEPELQALNVIFTDGFFSRTSDDLHWLRSTILYNDLLTTSKLTIAADSELPDFYEKLLAELGKEKDNVQDDLLRLQLKTMLLKAERERRVQDFVEIKDSPQLRLVTEFRTLLEISFIAYKQVSYYTDHMGISPKRLNHATQLILGETPKSLIDERVLLESKRLLSYASDSVKEIAFSLGFEEPTNFIKYFRKHTHHTPLQFRKMYTKE
jgi:AraC-like DNA-binding protein